jgi:two-component system cell cycle sensor histidine kinase/response regulator CckA
VSGIVDHVPRVLIVDDELNNCRLLQVMLSAEGFVLQIAANGPEALAMVAVEPPDLILLDVMMPGMDGYAVAAAIKGNPATKTIPIIMVTVRDDREAKMLGLRAGAEDFLSKPVDRAELCVRVRNLLRLKAYGDYHDKYGQLLESEVGSRTLELIDSQARYRRIVDTATEGIWEIDEQSVTTFMNSRMARMLGYEVHELIGQTPAELLYAEGIDELVTNVQQMRDGAQSAQMEVRFRRKDGTTLWAWVATSPILDSAGRFAGVLAMAMDITARRSTEAAQREAELRFRRLSESGIIGVIVTDKSGALIEANDTFLDLLGYARGDLEAQRLNWRTLTPPGNKRQPGFTAKLQDHGVLAPWEKEYLRKDGTRVPVLVGVATLDNNRNITVVTDLTEGRRAKERKAAVMSCALDAVVVMDAGGLIVEFNPAAEHMFGEAEADVLGRQLSDLVIPPRARHDHEHGVEHYLDPRADPVLGMRSELTARRRDGLSFPVELSIARMGSGTPTSFVGFIRDISDRKLAERLLLERMQVAALGADVGAALTTGDTLREILQRCASALVTHLGVALVRIWTFTEGTKRLDLEASAGLLTDSAKKFDVDHLVRERLPYVSNDLQHDDLVLDHEWADRERLRSFAGHPLLVDGELVGAIAMFARDPLTDVALKAIGSIADTVAVRIRGKLADHAKKGLEEQLRQAQKMEAVGRLAGGVAHDFNNLLSVILSYADFAMEDLDTKDPLRGDMEEIRKAGLRAADLTRQLLMFSRQQVIEPKVLDLTDVLASMGKLLQRIVGEDVTLTTVPGASLGHVCVDPGSIEQVIMNLVINGRDAMPTGGSLTLETTNVTLDDHFVMSHHGATAGPHVMVSVTDSGSGMDKTTLARIFEPFFTTKEKGKGTGLGLSTVFGIVQQGGGTVWVYSEPGIGTTFKVYLPQVDAISGAPQPARDAVVRRGTETVLLVEDEDQVRDVARGILKRSGYTVLEARNAGEALLLCERHPTPIDLLLSDVVMPGMSGPELAKRLGGVRPEMKVLCMSGYTDDAAVRHGVIEAHFAYIQKPLTVDSLTRKVREVLER